MISVQGKVPAIAQCSANIAAVLKYHNLPKLTPETSQTDRITAQPPEGFIERLTRLSDAGVFKAWNFVRNHGTTARRGWRENVATCSMQLVEHASGILEIDIDLVNPGYGDLVTGLGHTLEVLWNKFGKRTTDPFKIRAGLIKRQVLEA